MQNLVYDAFGLHYTSFQVCHNFFFAWIDMCCKNYCFRRLRRYLLECEIIDFKFTAIASNAYEPLCSLN